MERRRHAVDAGGNRGFFIRCVRAEYPAFVRSLEVLPAARMDYRPHEGAPSAGQLVWAVARGQVLGAMLLDRGEMRWQEQPPHRSLEEMIDGYRRDHAAVLQRLERLDEAGWLRTARFHQAGGATLEASVADLLWRLLFDALQARGQLIAYAGLMRGL